MSTVTMPVAMSLVNRLSALPGFPPLPEGVSWIADTLCDVTLSVEHARAVINAFEERFPTRKELRAVAHSLQEQFEGPKPDEKARWLAEGATYDPEWSENLLGALKGDVKEQFAVMRRRAIRDMLWYTEHPAGRGKLAGIMGKADRDADKRFWADAKRTDERDHAELVTEIRAEMQEPGAWDEYLEAA